MMLHFIWDVGYLPVSQRDKIMIKVSLQHLSISDILELSLKFSLYTRNSLSLNYLHWRGKQQEGYTRKKSLYTHGFLNCTEQPYWEDCIHPERAHYHEDDRKWIKYPFLLLQRQVVVTLEVK